MLGPMMSVVALFSQELLTSQDSSSSPAPHQQGPASPGQPAEGTAQPDTDDLVPISAWLGQDSGQEAMDRRIAEEALLAGVDAISEQALHEASVATSGAAGLAPGAAEGLASAPVQRQLDRTSASDSLSSDIQPSSGLSGRDDERTGTTAQGRAEISASSSSQETGFAADGSGNGVSTGRHAPSEETASNEQTSRGESSSAYVSRDPAGQQEAYREGSGAEAAQEQLAGLLEEGKALLRQGRELSRGGYDYGEADALLQDAMACFEEAAAIEPTSVKVLVCSFEPKAHGCPLPPLCCVLYDLCKMCRVLRAMSPCVLALRWRSLLKHWKDSGSSDLLQSKGPQREMEAWHAQQHVLVLLRRATGATR